MQQEKADAELAKKLLEEDLQRQEEEQFAQAMKYSLLEEGRRQAKQFGYSVPAHTYTPDLQTQASTEPEPKKDRRGKNRKPKKQDEGNRQMVYKAKDGKP